MEVIILHLMAGSGGTAPRHTPRPVTSSAVLRTPYVSDLPPIRIMASGRTHDSLREDHRPLMHLVSRASKDTKPWAQDKRQTVPEGAENTSRELAKERSAETEVGVREPHVTLPWSTVVEIRHSAKNFKG